MNRTKDNTFIITHTGERFYPWHPEDCNISIIDIAYALSNVCRFGGHSSRYYSVAEHSVTLSRYLVNVGCGPDEKRNNELWALLHDAAEAYIGDTVTPVKKMIPEFEVLEQGILACVASTFSLSAKVPNTVTISDKQLMMDEAKALMPSYNAFQEHCDASPLGVHIPKYADPPSWDDEVFPYSSFLDTYEQINSKYK